MTMTPEQVAAGLDEAQRWAYLTAEPRMRALDAESLFIKDSRGCKELPGTMVTLAGLMLTDLGLQVRAILEQQK